MKKNAIATSILIPLGFISFLAPIVNAQGAPGELDFEYFKNEVQPIFLAHRNSNIRCIQCHIRSSNFRLQPLADGAMLLHRCA